MPEIIPSIEPKLAEKLDSLRSIPPRDPAEINRRRADLLSEVEMAALAISTAPKRRLIGWKNPFTQKEMKPMFSSLVAILVAVALALGGAGVTVAAAQSALPGEALYGIKTASEDARLALSGDENRLELNLEFSLRRIAELGELVQAGQEIPEGVMERLQAQIENAFRIAAAQDDPLMLQTLERLRTRLQEQDELCLRLESQNQNKDITQAREMIQDRLRLVESGLQDPQEFRQQVGEGLAGSGEPGVGPGEPGYGTGEPGIGPGEPGYGTGEPGVGPGEPGYGTGEPGYGTGEPRQTPGAGTGEPGSGPGEPKATPGAGTGEPGVGPGEPGYGTGVPQATPGAGTGEPGTGPGGKP